MELKTSSKHWYVAYTFPNAEKSIQRSLVKMQITSFLPLRETVRDWKDRRKKISTPLFPNYIFIYSSHKERYEALCVKGIVKYVSFEGKPAIIRNEQIESLKRLVHGDIEVHQRSVLKPGNRVTITDGPFCGVVGTLERINGNTRLVVVIDCLGRAVSVNISSTMVTPIFENKISANQL